MAPAGLDAPGLSEAAAVVPNASRRHLPLRLSAAASSPAGPSPCRGVGEVVALVFMTSVFLLALTAASRSVFLRAARMVKERGKMRQANCSESHLDLLCQVVQCDISPASMKRALKVDDSWAR